MAPRPTVTESRKKQILDASMSVFSRTGFDKARMEDIAEESKVSKGLLHWYFKSKEEIILAMLDRLMGMEFREFRNLPADGSVRERLLLFFNVLKKDASLIQNISPVLFEFLAMAFRHPTVHTASARYPHEYMDMLVPILRQGTDQGEFRLLDPEETGLAICAALEGTFLIWAYDPARADLEKQMDAGIHLVIRGLEPVRPPHGGGP